MKSIAIIIITIGFASTAIAQERTPRVDNRQAAQHGRICDGRTHGDLTRRESSVLQIEQRQIRRTERRLEADGQLTWRERMRLEQNQDRASRHIRRAKHNQADASYAN